MSRKIIEIDENKCIGCSACANTCHESAIKMVNGKAKLISSDYCDGLGRCLPQCPVDAIKLITIDEVDKKITHKCPSTLEKTFNRVETDDVISKVKNFNNSKLNQWPVQIKLVNPNASFLNNSDLLVAADCCAYAYGNFHNDFLKDRVVIIGCPKLDNENYKEKIKAILRSNNISSIKVVRMSVPCCFGIEASVKEAINELNSNLSVETIVISPDGNII